MVACLLALLARSSVAAEPRPLAVQLGIGSHYGGAGGALTWRPTDRLAALVGAGNIGFGAGVRGYALGPLYGQLGFSPQYRVPDQMAVHGVDLSAGVDLSKGWFSFTFGLGVAVIGLSYLDDAKPTVDLGLGVNLGHREEGS
jgi:hypothetical protein